MSGIQTYITELLSQLLADRTVMAVVGGLVSPVKLLGLVYGFYQALSPNRVKPMQNDLPSED